MKQSRVSTQLKVIHNGVHLYKFVQLRDLELITSFLVEGLLDDEHSVLIAHARLTKFGLL
jgi:hypothetical protein